jgi:hypothetical protein
VPFNDHFMKTPTFGICEVFHPSSSDSPYVGGHGYSFCFNDGRTFEIAINHYPRRITIKKWCDVSLDEFLEIMKNECHSLF